METTLNKLLRNWKEIKLKLGLMPGTITNGSILIVDEEQDKVLGKGFTGPGKIQKNEHTSIAISYNQELRKT